MANDRPQKRRLARDEKWLAYMTDNANEQGFWHSNKRSRAGLPDSKYMTDSSRNQNFKRLVDEGRLLRVKHAHYFVVDSLEDFLGDKLAESGFDYQEVV